MPQRKLKYKSFCWCFGNTSFRRKDLNKATEDLLALVENFWSEYGDKDWNEDSQEAFYDFLFSKRFVKGNAANKPKDAREITAGLFAVGLIDEKRKLSEVGKALLKMSQDNDFADENFFRIAKDSFLYLRQLIKSHTVTDGNVVRPFVVLLYLLSRFKHLTYDEFAYLLPLCVSDSVTHEIADSIELLRKGKTTVDDIVLNRLLAMDNYKAALNFLLEKEADENVICEAGMNRKSPAYDRPYYPLYQKLCAAYLDKDDASFAAVYDVVGEIKTKTLWRKYLFKKTSRKALINEPRECLNKTLFDGVSDINEFKTAFFKVMHLMKAKQTLNDYCDLNKRYIKTADIILFGDGEVKLDIIPKHFFAAAEKLYESAYVPSPNLFRDCDMTEIDDCLAIGEKIVVDGINREFGENFTSIDEARGLLESERYKRLQHLIDTVFTKNNILTLLDCFEKRDDKKIHAIVTDNADVPTIFEYVVGILWYKASERRGKILDFMKLSLDADLLPKTHAAGGEADIVYEYDECKKYPSHTLLLEATLTDGTNQRRMEMEPVSRHLGRHLLNNKNKNSYCLFVTNDLNINVIADFRNRKNMPYYDTNDTSNFVSGMKIISLETAELKLIVEREISYKKLYGLFESAFESVLPPHEWYESAIKEKLNAI